MKGNNLVTFTHFFLSIKYDLLVFVTFLLLIAPSAVVLIDLEYNEQD